MCMMLAVSAETKETTKDEAATEQNTESTAEDKAEDSTDKEDSADNSEDAASGDTRLVSVDNVEKYITIAEYKGITLDNSVQEVTDDDVDSKVTQNLQAKSETVDDEDAVIQDGDTATINFVGTKDGEAFDGGTANNYDLVIGSRNYDSWL